MLKRLNPSITPAMLHQGLPPVIVASVILAAGAASLILWRLRSRDPLLLWLSIFASLYAIRLFITNPLVILATGADPDILSRASALITYAVPIPLLLFLRVLVGPGWKNSIGIWLWIQVVFSVVEIAAGVFGGYLGFANTANSLLIISGILLLLLHVFFFYPPESGAVILRSGLGIFCACVLLRNFGIRGFGPNAESLGFLALIVALGCVAALRSVAHERKLFAVEQELATARRIQASILPKSLPAMPGLEIATRYVPMTSVAGDFYDFLLIDDRRMTILVADVSGHGVPAALIASMLKVGIAAQRQNARDPAAILSGLNTMLTGVLEGQFVTAACAFVDLELHTLTYSAAGHPPALLARSANSDVLELEENGLFLGPFPKAAYANLTVPFQAGDRLLLYTDGIVEATLTNGQPFGDDGLKKFVMQHHASALPAFANDLIRAASGPLQEDDLTLVVAHAL